MKMAKDQLEAAGVTVRLPETDFVDLGDGEVCSGYFDDQDPEEGPVFACATGRDPEKWFPIFVHEFCHFEQWNSRPDWWASLKFDGKEGLDLVLEHWAGKRALSPTEVVRYCLTSAECELDCERRVLRKIEKSRLPIDEKHYARSANSYITFYYAMPELRAWYKRRPYEIEEVLELMPDHLDLSHLEYWELTTKAMPFFRRHAVGD